MELVEYGFYKVKDRYFSDFPSDRHMYNKAEGRPYYLAIKDKSGIIWLVPISSKVEKYRGKIASDKRKFGECLTCHIIRFMSEERAVLIGNMIPVTEEYIKGEFTISNMHYIVKDASAIKEIKKRCSRYLSLVRAGKLHPYVDILSIEKALLNRLGNSEYII